ASTALQGAPEGHAALTTLHRFRAEVMTGSPDGRQLIAAFNQHRWETSLLLLRDSALLSQTRGVLTRLLPKIQAIVDGRSPGLSSGDAAAVDRLMQAFSAQASPGLQRTIAGLRSDLRSGKLLSRFHPAGAGGASTIQPTGR